MNEGMLVAAFMTGWIEQAVKSGSERSKAIARAAEEAAWRYKIDARMAMSIYFTYKERVAA
jgi:hypothetical protein